jgi:hypothetical protein
MPCPLADQQAAIRARLADMPPATLSPRDRLEVLLLLLIDALS